MLSPKAVIYLDMAGAPPQHDLFDWKPKLVEMNMQLCPEEILKGEHFAFSKGRPRILGSPYEFAQLGQSGAWVSELPPQIASTVDDLCFVKSMRDAPRSHAGGEGGARAAATLPRSAPRPLQARVAGRRPGAPPARAAGGRRRRTLLRVADAARVRGFDGGRSR